MHSNIDNLRAETMTWWRWNICHRCIGTATESHWNIHYLHARTSTQACAGTSTNVTLEHRVWERWNTVNDIVLEHRHKLRWNIVEGTLSQFHCQCSSAPLSVFPRKIVGEPGMAGLVQKCRRCSSAGHRCSSARKPPFSRCSSEKCPLWCNLNIIHLYN